MVCEELFELPADAERTAEEVLLEAPSVAMADDLDVEEDTLDAPVVERTSDAERVSVVLLTVEAS